MRKGDGHDCEDYCTAVVFRVPVVCAYRDIQDDTRIKQRWTRGESLIIMKHRARTDLRTRVICIISLVNWRTSMRYVVDSRSAAAVTRSSKYAVCLGAVFKLVSTPTTDRHATQLIQSNRRPRRALPYATASISYHQISSETQNIEFNTFRFRRAHSPPLLIQLFRTYPDRPTAPKNYQPKRPMQSSPRFASASRSKKNSWHRVSSVRQLTWARKRTRIMGSFSPFFATNRSPLSVRLGSYAPYAGP